MFTLYTLSFFFFLGLLLPLLQDLHSPSMNYREGEVEEKPQKFLNEKQQENQELLIRCIALPLGFAGNKPIAACVIYKCLLHWRSFEVDRTSIFDRLIQTIGHAIEVRILSCYVGMYVVGVGYKPTSVCTYPIVWHVKDQNFLHGGLGQGHVYET